MITTPLSSSSALPIITILLLLLLLLLTITTTSTSNTIAVTYGSNPTTVCSLSAGKPTHNIQCYKNDQTLYLLQPNSSFDSISGGLDLLCGLKSGGSTLLCFNSSTFQPKRIYHNLTHPLTELTVGTSHLCAIQSNNGLPLCWRSQSQSPNTKVAHKFRTLTSGDGFTCGILREDSRVLCWGSNKNISDLIQTQFGNLTMESLVAGDSHVCGVSKTGFVVCKGNNSSGQLNVPFNSGFEFSVLAMGASHSCGIRRKNGFVVCWGGGFGGLELVSESVKFVSFEVIVAGLDFTCGLTTENLSVICWGFGWNSGFSSGTVLPLAMSIPGPCVQSSCSVCGVYPNSDSLCSGFGSICKSCEIELPIPALIAPVPRPMSPSSGAKNNLFLAFGIVGCIGSLFGMCSFVYCLWRCGVCGLFHEKIDTSVGNVGGALVANVASLRSASLKSENSGKLRNQRSASSSKNADRGEEFSLAELSAASNDFSQENKIGGGSFGTVYRGKLGDGREVAIKRGEIGARVLKKFQEKETAFDSELVLLSRLHHKHLVELVGFCQENDERLLVYEYMSNGSLHDHLHNKTSLEKNSNILNSWKMRIKIALDASRGVEYLHNYAVPPIIHRDIKSSNILLDANWTAKVSDFGLSLMGPEPDQESMSTKAVGTVGYIDPEYYVLNILTVKSDVYGLGVVLLELLTGKRAVFKEDGSSPKGVVEYARPRIAAGELERVLDERVESPAINEAEAVELVAYTALHCVSLEGKERPTITDIVVNLERALALCEAKISSSTFSIASQ